MAAGSRFTRIPKVQELVLAGVPTEAIPTYCALADHANNKNGLCWPKMETIATLIGRSGRTVQRHMHLLKELGLVEFVSRRRSKRGRFSSYLYRVLDIPSMVRSKKGRTTGHTRRLANGPPIFTRTKRIGTTPSNSPKDPYRWFMGKDTQYFDKDLPDDEGQMKLLALSGEALTATERVAEGLQEAKKGSGKRRRRKERSKVSSDEPLF